MDDVKYLSLAEYLLIAEAVLEVDAGRLAKAVRIELAESALHAPEAGLEDVEFYPKVQAKAAVLCSRLLKNHPLPDGNKRCAYLALREFLARNHYHWLDSVSDPGETVRMIESVAAGVTTEEELEDWICSRVYCLEDSEALAMEHGDFTVIHPCDDGDLGHKGMMEVLPGKIVGGGNAVVFHFADQVYIMRRNALNVALQGLPTDPERTSELEFDMGQVFPSDSPLARWIAVLGMMGNDHLRLIFALNGLEHTPDEEGMRLFYFRMIMSFFCEAQVFVEQSRKWWPEVDSFIDQEAEAELKTVQSELEKDPSLSVWMTKHRNLTFHYADLHPEKAKAGQDEIKEALTQASALRGTVTFRSLASMQRFGFADQVVAQQMPDIESLPILRDATLALIRFIQRVVDTYLSEKEQLLEVKEYEVD